MLKIIATLFTLFTFAMLLMPVGVCIAFLLGYAPWYATFIMLVITLIYAHPLVGIAGGLLEMAEEEMTDE